MDLYQKAEKVIHLAKARGTIIATAESCTAGMVSAILTSIPGSSEVFDCAFIAYSASSKVKMLGVDPDIIRKHTAISAEVAQAMVLGLQKKSGANLCLSITGNAGPSGEPLGRIYLGHSYIDAPTIVDVYNLTGTRDQIRQQCVELALDAMLKHLTNS